MSAFPPAPKKGESKIPWLFRPFRRGSGAAHEATTPSECGSARSRTSQTDAAAKLSPKRFQFLQSPRTKSNESKLTATDQIEKKKKKGRHKSTSNSNQLPLEPIPSAPAVSASQDVFPLICRLGDGLYSRRVFVIRSPTRLTENVAIAGLAQTRIADVHRLFNSQSSQDVEGTSQNDSEVPRHPGVIRRVDSSNSSVEGVKGKQGFWPRFIVWDLPVCRDSLSASPLKVEFSNQVCVFLNCEGSSLSSSSLYDC